MYKPKSRSLAATDDPEAAGVVRQVRQPVVALGGGNLVDAEVAELGREARIQRLVNRRAGASTVRRGRPRAGELVAAAYCGVVPVHRVVSDVVGTYLALVDAEAAGLVDGLYLTGSAALGDFRAATSDIDFVAVVAARPDAAAAAALQRVHRRLRRTHRRPFFDGGYVTWHVVSQMSAQSQPRLYHRSVSEHLAAPEDARTSSEYAQAAGRRRSCSEG